jgi:molybdate transport system ATP-binding protein
VLAVSEPAGLSARNVWESTIAALEPEQTGALLVRLVSPGGALLARVTHEAAMDLKLAPGQRVWAIVKAHSI